MNSALGRLRIRPLVLNYNADDADGPVKAAAVTAFVAKTQPTNSSDAGRYLKTTAKRDANWPPLTSLPAGESDGDFAPPTGLMAKQSESPRHESALQAPYGLYESYKAECISYDLYDGLREEVSSRATMNDNLNLNLNFSVMSPNCSTNASLYPINGRNSTHQSTVPEFQHWALVLFVLSLVTAFGNILVVLSVTREKSLQTVTNYFIISLAVADIMVGMLAMPFEIYVEMWSGVWTLPIVACDAYIATDVMSSTASILNLAAISIDRFVAVTQPIKYAKQQNYTRVFCMIALSWLISIGVALPVVFGVNEVPNRKPDECQFNNPDFILFSSLCSFYIPCIVILCLYWRIFIEIRRRSRPKEAGGMHNHAYGAESREANQKLLRNNSEGDSGTAGESKRTTKRQSVKKICTTKTAPPKISYSETEHNSADTNDTSDEQQTPFESDTYVSSLSDAANRKAAAERPTPIGAPRAIPSTEPARMLQDNSVSEVSLASNYQRGSSMRTNASQTASLELFENAFTDMDYVDELDPPLAPNGTHLCNSRNCPVERNSGHVVVENSCTAAPQRANELVMHTINEESHCALNGSTRPATEARHSVLSNQHAIVTFGSSPLAATYTSANRLLVPSQNSPLSHDSDSNEDKSSIKIASPSAKNAKPKMFKLHRKKSESRRDRNISRERKVTKTMIIVLACFLACWMPFFSLNVLSAFCLKFELTSEVCQITRELFIALTWLGYINSSLNPLIYCWQNREFRKAFHRLLTCDSEPSSGRRR